MRLQNVRPDASAIVASLRAIGYTFNTALADLIDNSISAGARSIDIGFRAGNDLYVAVLDDGSGMSAEALIAAMKHGGAGPSQARSVGDLGRYGLGLKTASLSQCRQLTVISSYCGVLAAARWDLDVIEREGDWALELLDPEEITSLPRVPELSKQKSGTLVLWRNFDRAVAGEQNPGTALETLVDDSRSHLALIFHRFIKPERNESGCRISINQNELDTFDPVIRSNNFTQELQTERIAIEGSLVVVRPFILPNLNKITSQELTLSGGGARLSQSQGFYVYRNRRLIIYGTWFRLLRQDELTKLVRVLIDIPNALDHVWDLDVKKSAANPPEAVRRVLRRIIDRIAEQGANVFRERRRRTGDAEITYLWERSNIRDAILYSINRLHPLVIELLEQLETDSATKLERLLKAVELALPTNAIYSDVAKDNSLDRAPEAIEAELRSLAVAMLAGADDPARRQLLLNSLRVVEPFSKYPIQTKAIVGTL